MHEHSCCVHEQQFVVQKHHVSFYALASDGSVRAIAVRAEATICCARASILCARASKYENTINTRQPLFASLPRLTSRIVDALRASGASTEVLQDVVTIKNRFNGSTKRLLTPAVETVPASEAAYRYGLSQLDFASKIENFERLVNRVSAEPLYKPGEEELKPTALTARVLQLRTANRNVMNANMALKKTANPQSYLQK